MPTSAIKSFVAKNRSIKTCFDLLDLYNIHKAVIFPHIPITNDTVNKMYHLLKLKYFGSGASLSIDKLLTYPKPKRKKT